MPLGLLKKKILTAKSSKPTFAKAPVGKICAKSAKLNTCKTSLCVLSAIPMAPESFRNGTLCALRLMDFDFFYTPKKLPVAVLEL
jgi:hypothetical protein